MTHTPHDTAPSLDPAIAGRRIELRWSAAVGSTSAEPAGGKRRRPAVATKVLVLMLQPVDDEHTLAEAWIDTPSGMQTLIARQPVTGRLTVERGFLHLDAHLGGRRIVALSMPVEPSPGLGHAGHSGHHRAARPLIYVRSALPAEAGFAPGRCDPPTARLLPLHVGAVSA